MLAADPQVGRGHELGNDLVRFRWSDTPDTTGGQPLPLRHVGQPEATHGCVSCTASTRIQRFARISKTNARGIRPADGYRKVMRALLTRLERLPLDVIGESGASDERGGDIAAYEASRRRSWDSSMIWLAFHPPPTGGTVASRSTLTFDTSGR